MLFRSVQIGIFDLRFDESETFVEGSREAKRFGNCLRCGEPRQQAWYRRSSSCRLMGAGTSSGESRMFCTQSLTLDESGAKRPQRL